MVLQINERLKRIEQRLLTKDGKNKKTKSG